LESQSLDRGEEGVREGLEGGEKEKVGPGWKIHSAGERPTVS